MQAIRFRTRLRRRAVDLQRRLHEARVVGRALASPHHPLLVHIIPTRRCNLACTYCNEYDDFSPPVPTPAMLDRIDKLAELGTGIVTLSGGEPLLHPQLELIIRRIRDHGMVAGLITNGYRLTRERIESLNEAGIEHLQISIDNIKPDGTSKKSLKLLDRKLELLAEHAEFFVNINSVLGCGVETPEDALTVARRARELGFSSTVGIIHDGAGQIQPLEPSERAIYEKVKRLGGSSYARITRFRDNLVEGRPNEWMCRAGSRYLYICEDGLVHYCSQQIGRPGIPLSDYTAEHLRRAFDSAKACAPHCTLSCAQSASVVDAWRGPQREVADLVSLDNPLPATSDGRRGAGLR